MILVLQTKLHPESAMTKIDRKAAVAAYKERKVAAGIYALRCVPTGQLWAGAAHDLGMIQNRLWFGLRRGSSPNRLLQAASRDHDSDQFTFEEVECFEEEEDPYLRDKQLRDRLLHWCAALGAQQI
jgi:hypothetical protein